MEKDRNIGIRTDAGSSGPSRVLEDLAIAKAERMAGYKGRPTEEVIAEMERIVAEAEAAQAERVPRP